MSEGGKDRNWLFDPDIEPPPTFGQVVECEGNRAIHPKAKVFKAQVGKYVWDPEEKRWSMKLTVVSRGWVPASDIPNNAEVDGVLVVIEDRGSTGICDECLKKYEIDG